MTAEERAAASMLQTGEGGSAAGFAGPSLSTRESLGAESEAQTALPKIEHGALRVCQAALLARACARLSGRKLAQAAERVAERLAKRRLGRGKCSTRSVSGRVFVRSTLGGSRRDAKRARRSTSLKKTLSDTCLTGTASSLCAPAS